MADGAESEAFLFVLVFVQLFRVRKRIESIFEIEHVLFAGIAWWTRDNL